MARFPLISSSPPPALVPLERVGLTLRLPIAHHEVHCRVLSRSSGLKIPPIRIYGLGVAVLHSHTFSVAHFSLALPRMNPICPSMRSVAVPLLLFCCLPPVISPPAVLCSLCLPFLSWPSACLRLSCFKIFTAQRKNQPRCFCNLFLALLVCPPTLTWPSRNDQNARFRREKQEEQRGGERWRR